MKQYILYGWDGLDGKALERRMAARPGHLINAARLKQHGNFIIGGAILDEKDKMIGSTMIMQFETENELQDWLQTEPYIAAGVWARYELRPFRVAQVQ